ncbi:MAG TPA: exodeoxyribonuclease V subunit alpha, partial [Marmoricola sp.]|nr:exodeoxyribonuclease V subunit alpha [Marmoricola sp.]
MESNFDRGLARRATGLLAQFNQAGLIGAADVHVASRLGAILEVADEQVLLALALTVAATRAGSVCLDLDTAAETQLPHLAGSDEALQPSAMPWPEPAQWLARVSQSAFADQQVLRLEGSRVYLDRYWREEEQVCADLLRRLATTPPEVDQQELEVGLQRVFPEESYAEQRDAVRLAAGQRTTILTGGPGTGKTTTVAGLLVLISEQQQRHTGQAPRIALCAPTGKASARLQEAINEAAVHFTDSGDRERLADLEAMTMHRLLGPRGKSNRFRHHRGNRLPHDVIVVDEASMMPLTMMARLLEATRDETRLIFVGDPDQLSSVEAGAILADLVVGFAGVQPDPVAALRTTHRFGAQIGQLAQALRDSDADQVLATLRSAGEEVTWIRPDDQEAIELLKEDLADNAHRMRIAADAGRQEEALQLLGTQRLLCAHREGPHGVSGWNRMIERLVGERAGSMNYDQWYAGRPVLLTVNDPVQHLRNGDMGVVLRRGDGHLRVVIDELKPREFAPSRLTGVETTYAMTVHKSQGSEANDVVLALPDEPSPVLTRELVYTAVTRARRSITICG